MFRNNTRILLLSSFLEDKLFGRRSGSNIPGVVLIMFICIIDLFSKVFILKYRSVVGHTSGFLFGTFRYGSCSLNCRRVSVSCLSDTEHFRSALVI